MVENVFANVDNQIPKSKKASWKSKLEKQAGLTGSVGLQRIAFRGKAKTSIENSLEESAKSKEGNSEEKAKRAILSKKQKQ